MQDVGPGETETAMAALHIAELYWLYGITTFNTIDFDVYLSDNERAEGKGKPVAHVTKIVCDDVPKYTIDKSNVIYAKNGITIGYLGVGINDMHAHAYCERFYIENTTGENVAVRGQTITVNGRTIGVQASLFILAKAGSTKVFSIDIAEEVLQEIDSKGATNPFIVTEELEVHLENRVLRPIWTHDIAADVRALNK